jgi:hypothetical protein
MNKFTPNSALTINNQTYTITLRQNSTLILSIEPDNIIRTLPIKMIGSSEYITINNKTLFANDFEVPTPSPIKMRDFTKEEAEKYQEYLSTLYKPIGVNINDPIIH